ncbi:MerR family transcriptional regulator [Nocardia sp. NBC_01329]|uniref:MerR family transcriptional regulator n=1 Tax=Nocardia sp. NBC_01329 TaxID=2903594 RepID=UPI002E10DF79|nr:MerR family transcriptional regulator [Nocardia sp. NBC_01329]
MVKRVTGADRRGGNLPGAGQGVYAISVAAELAGVGVQTLRLYEQYGLVTPARSSGGTRRYSHDDLARLHRITELTGQGIPLTAIGRILELEDANTTLRDANAALTTERDRLRDHGSSQR